MQRTNTQRQTKLNWYDNSIMEDAQELEEVKQAYLLKCQENQYLQNEVARLKGNIKTIKAILNEQLPF